jgi:hypothetical protein
MAAVPTQRPVAGRCPIRAWRAADLDRVPCADDGWRLARIAFGAREGQPLGALTRAIRFERLKAANGRAGYDVARHVALVRALRGLAKIEGAPRR